MALDRDRLDFSYWLFSLQINDHHRDDRNGQRGCQIASLKYNR
jgi:hypothetical protein